MGLLTALLVLAATRETSIEETREGEVAPLSELDETNQEEVRVLEFVHGLPKGERAIFLKRVAAANNLKLSPAPAPFCTKHQSLGSWYIKTGGEQAVKSGWKGPPLDRCCRTTKDPSGANCHWFNRLAECEAGLKNWSTLCLSCAAKNTPIGCPMWSDSPPPAPTVDPDAFVEDSLVSSSSSSICGLALAPPLLFPEKDHFQASDYIAEPLDARRSSLPPCSGATGVAGAGRWAAPCDLGCANVTSCNLERAVWLPDACRFKDLVGVGANFRKEELRKCLQGQTIVAVGDSILRGPLARMLRQVQCVLRVGPATDRLRNPAPFHMCYAFLFVIDTLFHSLVFLFASFSLSFFVITCTTAP